MRLTRITAPSTGVVSLAEAMDHLRISDTGEAALVEQYVAAASAYLDARDGILGEALVTQSWRLYMDTPDEVTLPLGPVQSITAVKYLDAAGAEQTFGAANYRLSGADFVLVDGAVWPTVASREEAFWIDFVAGYGPASAVPATARQTALMLIGEMYEARTMGAEMQTSDAFKMLLAASRSERGLF
jgi:uncharacterized phiE125 gp8 family phage protein